MRFILRISFDTTTVAYYGDSDQHEELLDYGFSKIRRSDLKQIVVGIIMSKQGIPLGHEVFEGNKNDVTCFKEIIDRCLNPSSVDSGLLIRVNLPVISEWGHDIDDKKG